MVKILTIPNKEIFLMEKLHKIKTTMAQNKIAITLILGLVATMTSAMMMYSIENPTLSNTDFIRLHVVANSDTYQDQLIKLKVRDSVLDLVSPNMSGTVLNAADYIRENYVAIHAVAESTLREYGYDYPVRVELKPTYIPEKTYDNVTFPEGTYEALNIYIGEADGSNWWCVVFPPLCLIDTSPEANKSTASSKKINIKFKSVEILEKTFGKGDKK